MTLKELSRHLAVNLATLPVFAASALAHHGWSWAEDAPSELTAIVDTFSVALPYPSLTVRDADGLIWQIDLGNPARSRRAGLTAETLVRGDRITVLGHRSTDDSVMLMKAVRISFGDRSYDLYPDRLD